MNREQRSEHVARLLQQIKRGSKEAFAQFYDEYVEFVFRIALNTIDDRQEAEDVCHDVFLEVYQKPESYDPARGSVAAWLAVKTRSRCLDRLRKKKPVFIDNWEGDTVKRIQYVRTSLEPKGGSPVPTGADTFIVDLKRSCHIAHSFGRPK